MNSVPRLARLPGESRPSVEVETSFRAGDADALRCAYDLHGALVHTFCRRAVGVDSAADLTQEVFITAWRRRERFDAERGSLPAWLIGIAKFKVLESLRRQPPVPADGGPEQVDRTAARFVDDLADRMLVVDALETLPDRTRTVINMSFRDELTHAEIAHRTALPLGTVKSDIRRGFERMRRYLEHHDV